MWAFHFSLTFSLDSTMSLAHEPTHISTSLCSIASSCPGLTQFRRQKFVSECIEFSIVCSYGRKFFLNINFNLHYYIFNLYHFTSLSSHTPNFFSICAVILSSLPVPVPISEKTLRINWENTPVDADNPSTKASTFPRIFYPSETCTCPILIPSLSPLFEGKITDSSSLEIRLFPL